MPELPLPPATLIERVAALKARISALEANLGMVEEKQPDPAELGRLAWFIETWSPPAVVTRRKVR